MLNTDTNFEEALKENLLLYTCPSPCPDKDLFQTHREISLARYALTQQANAYEQAINVLTTMLEIAAGQANSPQHISQIMVCINGIELKSQALINSVERVVKLIGDIASIDIDRAALCNMIVNLPSLVQETISSISNDPELAQRISNSLNHKISEMMVALKFSGVEFETSSSSSGGVSMDQLYDLVNSVPSVNYSRTI